MKQGHAVASVPQTGARRKIIAAVLVLACLALALPGGALAADANEPNEGIHQAAGGLVTGTNYNAEIGSSSDRDWFIVHVSGPGALTVTMLNINDTDACSTSMTLRNSDGEPLNSTTASNNTSSPIAYTAPGAGHYFVNVTGGCPVNRYRLTVSGPAVAGPRPADPQPTANTNREAATALGPLSGGVLYGASIDAFNEQDWFFFYTGGPGTFDIALTNVIDNDECSVSLLLRRPDGTSINSTSANVDRIAHIQYTAAGAEKFELRMSGGCPVNLYRFQVTPGSLLTSTAPPPPSDRDGDGVPDASDRCADASGGGRADGCPLTTTTPSTTTTPVVVVSERCTRAQKSVTNWTKRLARANKALKKARKAVKRRGLSRRKLASLNRKVGSARSTVLKAKRSLKTAQRRVQRDCT